MVHDGTVAFLQEDAIKNPTTWASTMSVAAHEEIVRKQRQLIKAIAASATVMLIELAGGIYAHSLALLSDSAHMLADIASYCIALIALQVTLPLDPEAATCCGPKEAIQQKLSERASFGLHRVEVLGGLGSILVVWLTAGGLLYEGVSRLAVQLFGGLVPGINGAAFVLVAASGLVFNALILYLFRDVSHAHGGHGHDHGHSHGDSNVTARAAVVHAVGDIAQSLGMLVTASLITLNGARWSILDPLVTIVCSLYMLYGTLGLLREVFLVLIEATPLTVDAHAVRDALRKRSEVLAIKCFHVWALAPGKVMLTACVQTTEDCEDTDDVLRELQSVCRYKFGIHHATFQVTRDASLMR
jgi:solute carrier family 30 (zinc transporter), member 2